MTRYEFGNFVLDVPRRLLSRDGEAVALAPKAVDLLLALLERPGQVVEKNELMERAWPGTFVEDANIAQNISLLRKALGDPKSESRWIITVPRMGYQFGGPVRAVPVGTADAPMVDGEGGTGSVAVVPFTCLSGTETDGIGMLMANALVESLRASTTLRVYESSETSSRDQATVLEWARSTGADAVLLAYYQRHARYWHVAVQFLRADDGAIRWVTTIRGEFSTLSDVHEAISSRVLAQLARPQNGSSSAMFSPRDVNRDAFYLYLRGRHLWNKRTPGALQLALDHAIRAVDVDPAFTKGHVGIADTYNLLGAQNSSFEPREAFPRARTAAMRALEIDPSCGQAYASIAFVNTWYDFNIAEAERNFCRAIELKPLYPTAHHWYAEMLASAGRFRESFVQFETAVALDPLSSAIRTDLAAAISLAGDYTRCERVIEDLLAFDREFPRAGRVLAANSERSGDFERAHTHLLTALRAEPESLELWAAKARVNAAAGRRTEAEEDLARVASGRQGLPRVEMASAYVLLGQVDRAQTLLEEAFQRREPQLAWIVVDPCFQAIRAETDFAARWRSASRGAANVSV